jgi:hypothetical protein
MIRLFSGLRAEYECGGAGQLEVAPKESFTGVLDPAQDLFSLRNVAIYERITTICSEDPRPPAPQPSRRQ